MNFFGLFKAINVKVWFDNTEIMHDFEKTCLIRKLYIESDVRKVNSPTCMTGGFEDGHVEVTYPIKRNMVAKFKMVVKYYSYFMPDYMVKLVG